jgi:prepilin-type N-terminal cleavage/methylation domain-containing protein
MPPVKVILDNPLTSRRKQDAFTLLEMSVVLAIFGVAILTVISVILPAERYFRFHATNANMEKIILTLAAYAQHNNRIPCPADPNPWDTSQPSGAEVGSTPTGASVPDVLGQKSCKNVAGNFNEGIVPYATLGLTPADVKDGWGDYITYHVNPVFAADPSPVATTPTNPHARCRVSGTWINGSNYNVGGAINRDPEKAAFCCPSNGITTDPDITINDVNGKALWTYPRDANAADYAPINTATATTSFDPVAMNVETIAFVLVSHGPTGEGSYTGTKHTGSPLRIPFDANAGTSESENGNGDTVFVDAPWNSISGANRFQNILAWRTQDTLYSSLGHLSCQIP